jgi:broad specificity phosphatase PhoE
MNPALQLCLIRHGETLWSLTGQHTGRTDLSLTPHGEQQARALVPRLRALDFSRVLSSPRLRARQTCNLAGQGQLAEVDADLAEWDYGVYEGLRTAEIQQLHPQWDVWRDGGLRGESPLDVSDRADRLIARLQSLGGNVALFSHGQFARVLAARWIGLPAFNGQHFAIDPASVSILGHDAGHQQRRVIALLNETGALPPA